MELGEVYYWTTDKAIGYDQRPKYHVFISSGNWKYEELFLFISSNNNFADFEIKKADGHEFLTKDVSYISMSPVQYTIDDLDSYNIPPSVGKLSPIILKALAEHIHDSDVMEQHYIDHICKAIYEALK